MCECNPHYTQTRIQKRAVFTALFFYNLEFMLLNILSTKNNPRATAGPIPNANNKVPIPTVPPRYHPIDTTDISRNALTAAIGKFVFSCKPIISPSLGPGPKFATR